jgi:Citrate transporter
VFLVLLLGARLQPFQVLLDQRPGYCLRVIAGLMVLFVSGKIRYDLAALLGLLAAVGTGIVPVDKAFGSFSDQVVIIVGSALIISAGVSKSGVIARLIRRAEPYMRTPGTQVLKINT